jgi:hypothetical protein
VILMTSAALYWINTIAVNSTTNVHCVSMAVVALARIVPRRMAVHTPRVVQHRNYRLKRSRPCCIAALLTGSIFCADQPPSCHAQNADTHEKSGTRV